MTDDMLLTREDTGRLWMAMVLLMAPVATGFVFWRRGRRK